MLALSARRRYLILSICCLSLLMVGIDNSAVNVALPSIQRDMSASVSGLQWTLDRFGRHRVFQAGLATFVAGSALCGLAADLGALVAARALQGIGGAMMNPVAMSLITNTFTDARERARA